MYNIKSIYEEMMSDIFDLFKKIERPAVSAGPVEYLAVCLGNPGKEYAKTRHNCGFIFAEHFSKEKGFSVDRAKFDALCGETVVNGHRVLFLCPLTYMNLSGVSVRKAADFYKIPPERIIVFCDDINLDVGKMRIRKKGSDGGQKGVRSIIEHLSSDNFPRVKIGVGKKPNPDYPLADWVLSKFSPEELKTLSSVMENCTKALPMIISGNIETAMNSFN